MFALSVTSAYAGSYAVTTTEDVLDFNDCLSVTVDGGNDGLLSLREAVCLANVSKGEDTIVLSAGAYVLNLEQLGGDDNTSGDLDITDSLVIQGAGFQSTSISNGFGDSEIDGDGDRLLDFLVNENSNFDLSISNLSLTDADLGCVGDGCESGAAVVNFRGRGVLSINDVVITNNQNSCLGLNCGDITNAAVFTFFQGGTLSLVNTDINNNRTFCEVPEPVIRGLGVLSCMAGNVVLYASSTSILPTQLGDKRGDLSSFTMTTQSTKIENNNSSCTDCELTDLISIQQPLDEAYFNFNELSISNNSLSCSGTECSVGSMFHSDSSVAEFTGSQLKMNNNSLSCEGIDCDTDYLFRVNTEEAENRGGSVGYGGFLRIDGSEFNNNIITCVGDFCSTDELLLIDESQESILTSTSIKNNQQTCFGEDCGTDELIEMCCEVTSQIIRDVVISNNIHQCDGDDCDTDEILDVGTNVTGGTVQIENVSLVDNLVSCTGEECSCDVAGIHFRADGGINTINQVTIANNMTVGDELSCGGRATAGIRNSAENLLITNSTIHGNRTVGSGGGILNSGGLILDHVTITDNEADIDNDGLGFGSGICNEFEFQGSAGCGTDDPGGSIQMSNTILNNNNTQAPDCYGLLDSNGFNLVNDDSNCSIAGDYISAAADLLPLVDNGCIETLADGSCVYTQLANESSPVIDAGSCFSGQNVDQRGVERPFDVTAVVNADDGCDIGATESFSDLIFKNGFE